MASGHLLKLWLKIGEEKIIRTLQDHTSKMVIVIINFFPWIAFHNEEL